MSSIAAVQPRSGTRDSDSGVFSQRTRLRLLLSFAALAVALLAILVESSAGMGFAQTGQWLRKALGPAVEPGSIELLNIVLRKLGHLTGYGFLGLFTERVVRSVWQQRTRVQPSRFLTSSCGVAAALAAGTCDEVHQSFLSTRHGSMGDVALDTFGATLFLGMALYLRSHAANGYRDRLVLSLPAAAGAAA